MLLKVKMHSDTKSGIALTVQHRLFLPSAKHRWITAACYVPSQNDYCSKTVVCGDKDGSILLYFLNNESDVKDFVEPHQIFLRVHSKAGTTFVCYREGHIYSAGRDGFYRQWQIQNDTLVQLHGSKVVRGFEWIERLEWNHDDLLVYGFFSSQFVVWSINYNQQLMAAICGGGHRSWGCCHNDSVMRFVYLKAGSIYMVDRENSARQTIVKPPLHGREVCDVKFLHIIESNLSGLMHVVCSASEDNTINVGVFAKKNNFTCWAPLIAIKGHLSSVRAIAVGSKVHTLQYADKHHQTLVAADRGENRNIHFLIFTGGGRAEIRVWKVRLVHNVSQDCTELKEKQTDHSDSAVESMSEVSVQDTKKELISDQLYTSEDTSSPDRRLCPATISSNFECSYEHLSTHFLGESRHKKQYSTWKTQRLHLDPETRIMSLAATPLVHVLDIHNCDIKAHCPEDFSAYHVLSAAGSDGYFRIFLFDEKLKQFRLLVKSYYHQGCVLKVIHYIHKTSTSNISLAFSASTNGQIVLWDLGTLLEKIVPSLKPNKRNTSRLQCLSHFATQNMQKDFESSSSDDDAEDLYTDFNCESNNEYQTGDDEWKPYYILTANQSGINSLHTLQISDTEFMVASGGDDNAICVHILELRSDILKVVARAIKTDAHAAQITGIWLVSPSLLISASIDQRINIWRIQNINGSNMEFQMLASKYMNIANVTNMDVHLNGDAVYIGIGGEGLCLYKLEPNDSQHTL
ncbi:hypothetical protein Btru_060249 [Bulinus truncatus]|nr:hypothetical protein Btru_060249 [Bulinus truncatus]